MPVLCFMFLQNPFSAIGANFFILPISRFLFLSSLKFEMEEEKRGKMEEITSNFKAMKKKKTLLRLSTKQGLKLCVFIFIKR